MKATVPITRQDMLALRLPCVSASSARAWGAARTALRRLVGLISCAAGRERDAQSTLRGAGDVGLRFRKSLGVDGLLPSTKGKPQSDTPSPANMAAGLGFLALYGGTRSGAG